MEVIVDTEFAGYKVSNKGYIINPRGKKLKGCKEIDQWGRVSGLRVGLPDPLRKGKKRWLFIHRIVAKYFLGPKPGHNYTIDHKDRNPLNNSFDNLRWATPKMQGQNRFKTLNKVVQEEEIVEWKNSLFATISEFNIFEL